MEGACGGEEHAAQRSQKQTARRAAPTGQAARASSRRCACLSREQAQRARRAGTCLLCPRRARAASPDPKPEIGNRAPTGVAGGRAPRSPAPSEAVPAGINIKEQGTETSTAETAHRRFFVILALACGSERRNREWPRARRRARNRVSLSRCAWQNPISGIAKREISFLARSRPNAQLHTTAARRRLRFLPPAPHLHLASHCSHCRVLAERLFFAFYAH